MLMLIFFETIAYNSVIQPCDVGIIRAFKAKYRSKIIRHILLVYEEKNKYEEIDLKQAIYYIREAWREVSKQTIKNCWKKTRITNDEENEDVVLVLEEEEKKASKNYFSF